MALGAAVAGVTAYVLTYALDTTSFLNDEYGNVIGGRLMAREPLESLTATSGTVFGRGPERLASIVLAVPDAVLSGAASELRASHVLLALAYALVAVPAYALLRGLDVPRWPAVGLAVAAILGPWMVFGATLLNVTLAAPLTVAFAWTAWRAVVRPSLGAEALAVGVAALMTTARASHAVFFAAAVLAAVATAWWTRPEGEPLARVPLHLVRRTPLIVAVTVVGALALLVFGTGTLAGRDYEAAARLSLPWEQLWAALGWTTAVLAIATGFVPLMVGGAWAARQAVRPADLRSGAFAVIALTIFFAYVYLMGASGAQEQERYAAPLAALPIVALGAALFRRGEATVIGTAIVGLLVARAIATRAVDAGGEALNHFFSPAELFFSKVVVGRLTTILPAGDHTATVAALLAVAAAMLACLAPKYERAWHRNIKVPGTGRGAGAVVVALVVLGVVSGVYTLRKYEPATSPGDLDAMAWLDRVTGGEDALLWNYQWAGNAADRDYRTRLTLHFNSSPCCGEWRPHPGGLLRPDGSVTRAGTDPVPRFVAGPTGFRPIVFAAELVAKPEAYGQRMRVDRFVDEAPRAAARIEGAAEDGAVDRSARFVALPALGDRCLDVQLYVRPDAPGPVGFALGGERGRLKADEVRWVRVRGAAEVRRTAGEAPLYVEETRYVACDAPPARD